MDREEKGAEKANSAHTRASSAIGRHSAIYAIGSIVSMAAGLIMLPVYTHALSPADYGVLELCLRFVSICMALAFLGLRQGFVRLYYDSDDSASESALLATTLVANFTVAVLTAIPLGLVALFAKSAASSLHLPAYWPILAAGWLAMESTYLVGLSLLQVRMRSTAFVATQAGRLVLLAGFNITFLNVFNLGLLGALLGNFAVSLVCGAIVAVILLRRTGLRISRPKLRELLMFGWPYLPTAAMGYVMGNADRAVLISTGAIASIGLLSLAGKIGDMGLSIFITPVEKVWAPYVFAEYRKADGAILIGKVFTYYVALSVLLALIVSLGAPLLVRWFASAEYEDALFLVPILAMAGIFSGLANLADIGILIAKKTHYKPWIFVAGATTAVTLQLIFIPKFGVIGAAVAGVLSNSAMFLIVRQVSRRYYRLQTRRVDFIYIAVAGFLAFTLGARIQAQWPAWYGQVLGGFVGAMIYVAGLYLTRAIDFSGLLKLFREQRGARL